MEERTKAGIEAVSTWRGKGSTAKHEDFAENNAKGSPPSETTSKVVPIPESVVEGTFHETLPSEVGSGLMDPEVAEAKNQHVAT